MNDLASHAPGPADGAATLSELVRGHAAHQPGRPAYTFIPGRDEPQQTWTWGDLDRRARAIGAALAEAGQSGRPVLVLQPAGLEYVACFLGCLYAGAIAVPAYPPDVRSFGRALPRLSAIGHDCGAAIALTTGAVREFAGARRDQIAAAGLDGLSWIATESIDDSDSARWREPGGGRGSLALLQYTSGSTAAPKGVMVSHGNLLHNLASIYRRLEHDADCAMVSWLPPFHDMGLVGGILSPLFGGFPAYLMAPETFVARPLLWLETLSRTGASTSVAPNFGFEHCLRRITPQQRDTLRLDRWRLALNGAEPVRPGTLARFAAFFGPCGFSERALMPCYGLAEATLMVTGTGARERPVVTAVDAAGLGAGTATIVKTSSARTVQVVSCGPAVDDIGVEIVNPQTRQRKPDGQVGEIWVSGPSVARGYWRKPAQTQEVFRAAIEGRDGVAWLRTGDLGYLRDGRLHVVGRRKDVVIVAGRNYYPHDIELTVERASAAVRAGQCAAFAVDVDGAEQLAVACEVEPGVAADPGPVLAAVRAAIAREHELAPHAVVLLKRSGLPKTTSGKIQRQACRERFVRGELPVVAQSRLREDAELGPEPAAGMAAGRIEAWLAGQVAGRLGLPVAAVAVDAPLAELGLSSRQSVSVVAELGTWLGREIAPAWVFDHPTIRAVAADLGREADPVPAGAAAGPAAATGSASVPGPGGDVAEPVAIVGIGARFPGAPDVTSYWRLLQDGRAATGPVPADRWDPARTDAPDAGGFLDRVDEFDAGLFGISAREAERMDPQQRILLEVAWQALDDAGIAASSLAGSDTGVFVGISGTDYAALTMTGPDVDVHCATGNAHALAANRISYFFDWRGPSLALDTACSSSLVAIHLACRSLRGGECALALAGGVNAVLTPQLSVAFGRAGMLAPDGRCRPFDDAASGYVRAEGAGLICLKKLSDALADGDQIYAVIRGSATGHGGRSNGVTAPRGSAQRAVIEQALAQAGLLAGQVGYVEAHGTGTPLGDPVEWDALARAYGRDRGDQPCLVGSVKSTIGHLEAAAGVAGLVKAALVLRNRLVVPQRNLDKLNHRLGTAENGLSVPTGPVPLAADGSLHAGVSSFGFGGANAHIVLSSAPEPAADAPDARRERAQQVLCLSGQTGTALAALASSYRVHLAATPAVALADLCHSANTGRSHLPYRAAVSCEDIAGLDAALAALARDEPSPDVVRGHVTGASGPTVALLFSGQGTQYPGMGRALYETDTGVAATLDRAAEILRPQLGESLLDLLFAEDEGAAGERLRETRFCQPALVALEIALAGLWTRLGVRPAAVLGHSVGAFAAAHCAGVLSLEDALTLAAVRGRHMGEQPGEGAMIACVGDPAVTRAVAGRFPGLSVAAENTPDHVVLSGPRPEVEAAREQIAGQGVVVRPLQVSHAFHSSLMAGAAGPLRTAARAVRHQAARIAWVSDATGQVAGAVDADYWVGHMLGGVRFADGIGTLLGLGCDTFVEVGPHATLLSLGRATASRHAAGGGPDGGGQRAGGRWLATLRRGEPPWRTFLRSLGEAHCAGVPVDWRALDEGRRRTRVALPGTVFERQRYWFTPGAAQPVPELPDNHGEHSMPRAEAAEPIGADLTGAGAALLGHVSRVSGFPARHIHEHQRLGRDLGFDSLMKTELHRLISAQFPELTARLRDAVPADPTVGQLMALASGAGPADAATRSAPAPAPTPAAPPGTAASPTVRPERAFEDWAEYRELQQRLRTAEASGTNPYGRTHEGFNAGRATVDGREMINFSAFNYLALSSHPRLRAAAAAAIERYGTSCSATPLLCGETPLHHELDAEIAGFLGTDDAIVFAGGHATNVATIGHLFGPDDLILHDAWIHDSSVRGAMLSGARRRPFPHNDWRALDDVLTTVRDQYRRVLILIEGAYSQDGDLPDLPEFIAVKQRHDAMLMIDEAHSIGVLGRTGRGVGEHFGVDRADVDLWMGTLSKALGSLGGYVAGRRPLIEYLKFTTPLYIFSTGISPASAAAALEALRVIQDEPGRVAQLQVLADSFRAKARARGFDIGVSRASAVVPLILGDWDRAMRISNALLAEGVNVMPIGYPAVDPDKCRLRFFLNLDHSEADLDYSLNLLERIMTDSTSRPSAAQPAAASRVNRSAGTTRSGGAGRDADVLVTGASGFIGGHLARRLTDNGYRVRALVREGSDLSGLDGTQAEVVTGALDDTDSLRRAVAGVRHVYNCAGKSADWGAWEEFRSVNVDGAQRLVEAAGQAGTVERFVHVSTTDVYGYPVRPCDEAGPLTDVGLPYNRSKLRGEQAVKATAARLGLPLTVIRPVSVYGPGSKDFVIEIATLLLKKQMVYISRGQVPAGLIYVTNLADGMIAACESATAAGRAYNMRDGDLTTWREYVEELAAGLGVRPPSMNLPGPVAMGVARTSETLWGALRVKARPVLTRHAVRLFDRDQSYPIEAAREDFAFKSEVSFTEGMQLTLDWLRSADGHRAIPALAAAS